MENLSQRRVNFVLEKKPSSSPSSTGESCDTSLTQLYNNLILIHNFGHYPYDEDQRRFIWSNFKAVQGEVNSMQVPEQKNQLEQLQNQYVQVVTQLSFPWIRTVTKKIREDCSPLFKRKIIEEDEILAAVILRGTVEKAMMSYDPEKGSFFNFLSRPLNRDVRRIIIASQVGVVSSSVEDYIQMRSNLTRYGNNVSPEEIAEQMRRRGRLIRNEAAEAIENKLQSSASLDKEIGPDGASLKDKNSTLTKAGMLSNVDPSSRWMLQETIREVFEILEKEEQDLFVNFFLLGQTLESIIEITHCTKGDLVKKIANIRKKIIPFFNEYLSTRSSY